MYIKNTKVPFEARVLSLIIWIMGDRVPPRWKASAAPEEAVAGAAPQPDAVAFCVDRLPFHAGVKTLRQALYSFPTAAQTLQKWLRGGCQILAVAALQPDHGLGLGARHKVHGPSRALG